MISIKDVGKFFLFIIVGIGAIIVGSFMIRGTMHMWDNPEKSDGKKDKKSRKRDTDKRKFKIDETGI